MTGRGQSGRGFTLVELIVYLALVTGGLSVLMGLEMAASRAWFLEHALIDLAFRGDDLGTRLRDDVRQAVSVSQPPLAVQGSARLRATLLVVALPSGQEVRYEAEDAATIEPLAESERHATGIRSTGGRVVRLLLPKPGAEPKDRAVWSGLEKLSLERVVLAGRAAFEADATFSVVRGPEVVARRHFHYLATPVAGGAP